MTRAALLDVDGTLVDTNFHHALAWGRAFARVGVGVPPLWELHRAIGMGGDQLIAAVAGDDVEADHGDALREAEGDLYDELIGEVQPLPGARELLAALHDAGWTLVLASSAKPGEVAHYVGLLDARELVAGVTDASDAEQTKPAPDIVSGALAKAGVDATAAVFVGDSRWDCEAAAKAAVACLATRTGGYGADELLATGARSVHEDLDSLRHQLLGSG